MDKWKDIELEKMKVFIFKLPLFKKIGYSATASTSMFSCIHFCIYLFIYCCCQQLASNNWVIWEGMLMDVIVATF
jgi:hypothetical protein